MSDYRLLTEAYKADRAKQIKLNTEFIEKGYMSTWHESQRTESDNGLRRYSTDTRWKQYQTGKITREQAVSYATKRMIKEADKTTAAGLAKLERIAAAEELTFCTVNIEWTRSGTAKAEAWSNNGRYNGSAGGWGYDKESAAAADAFNRDDTMLKILYDLKEKGLSEGLTSDSETACTGHDNRNIVGYGAGYSVLPYFEGGVGIDCFWSILKKAGYKVSSFYGKHENNYRISKEG